MHTIVNITGYTRDENCEHCGRPLKHGIKLSDGRIVGATCFAKVLTKPRVANGKKFRLDAEAIIHRAKVAEFYPPHKWGHFGIYASALAFELNVASTESLVLA